MELHRLICMLFLEAHLHFDVMFNFVPYPFHLFPSQWNLDRNSPRKSLTKIICSHFGLKTVNPYCFFGLDLLLFTNQDLVTYIFVALYIYIYKYKDTQIENHVLKL